MAEKEQKDAAATEPQGTQDQAEKESLDSLKKQIANLITIVEDQKRRLEAHGSEMKQKKDREREALKQAEEEAKAKGELEKALQLREKRLNEIETERQTWERDRQQWAMDRKRMAVMLEVTRPGKFNAKIPTDDILRLLDVDKIELDETGHVRGWDDTYKQLISQREYLKPTAGTVPLVTTPPATGNGAGTLKYLREAQQAATLLGMNVETAQKMLQDEKIYKTWKAAGYFSTEPQQESLLLNQT